MRNHKLAHILVYFYTLSQLHELESYSSLFLTGMISKDLRKEYMPQCFKCLQHLMTYYILINIIHGAAAVVVRPFVGSKFWNI